MAVSSARSDRAKGVKRDPMSRRAPSNASNAIDKRLARPAADMRSTMVSK
jgi:hypothetical protein